MLQTLLAHVASGALLAGAGQEGMFQACLEGLMKDERAEELVASTEIASEDDDDFWPTADEIERGSFKAFLRPYRVSDDGILQIPVFGVLLHRFPYAFGSYATGYDYIKRAFDRGEADANVKGIALIGNSPGGMVAGCFELVDHMNAAKTKPLRAYAADHAYSACYAVFMPADTISVTRSGGVGSVGVVTSHVDFTGYMENAGIKITFIQFGKHKTDGSPYKELSDDAKARIQARINKLGMLFVSTVAAGRGMDESDVKATEALTYDSDEAIEIGFADKIESPEDGLKDFAAELNLEDEQMAQGQDTGKKTGNEDEAAVNAARAEGREAGAKAERERIGAILKCENAEGREAAAIELALDEETSFSAKTANTVLGRMPKAVVGKPNATRGKEAEEGDEDEDEGEEASAPKGGKPKAKGKDHFSAHMDQDKQPDTEATGGKTDESASDDEKMANDIPGSYHNAGGYVASKDTQKAAS